MSRDPRLALQDVIESCEKIQRYTDGITFDEFQSDDKTFDAVARNLEIIGEAVKSFRMTSARPTEASSGVRLPAFVTSSSTSTSESMKL